MKNRILFVFLMIVSLVGVTHAHQWPTVGPTPVEKGGTGARTAAAARTALGVGASGDLTTHETDMSTHGTTVVASQTYVDTDHGTDNSAIHGCTVVASQTAVDTKADLAGSVSQRFQAEHLFNTPVTIYCTNGDSVTATAGSLITFTGANSFILTAAAGYPDGVTFEDIGASAEGYVTIAGIASFVYVPLNATAGNYIFMDGTTAGHASASLDYPASHPQTIGKCLLTTTTGTTTIIIRR